MLSFLGVPITFRGRVLGNLYLTDRIGSEEFAAGDENIVSLFAAQAAAAIKNARENDPNGGIKWPPSARSANWAARFPS